MDKIKKEPLASFAHLNSNEFMAPSSKWLSKQIGDVCDIIMGESPPSSSYNANGSGLPFYQGNTDFGKIHPVTRIYCSSPLKKARTNDILVSVRAPVGALNIAKEQCCIGRGVAAIRANDADYIFLYYAIHQFQKILENLSSGSTFTAICKQDLTSLKIPLPPLPEQQRIATVLATVDEAIAATDAVIEKYQIIKQGLLNIFYRSNSTILVKDLIRSIKSGLYKKIEFYGKGYPIVRMFNIADGRINIIKSPLLEVTDQELEEFKLLAGDILINRVNAIGLVGKAGIVPKDLGPAVFENMNVRLRFQPEKILPEYFAFFTQTPQYNNQIFSRVKSAIAQASINQPDICNIKVPFRSLGEQREIVNVLATVDDRLATERAERDRLVTLKKGLMQVLLTGRVRIPPGVAEEVTPAHV